MSRQVKASRISSKNQVTLPVDALGEAQLKPGALVTIEADGPGRITVRAVDDALAEFVGALPNVWPPRALDDMRDEWR